MREIALIPIKVLYISLVTVKVLRSYRLPDAEYGGMLIFYGTFPGYYFNLMDKDCGQSLPEIVMVAKNHKKDVFSFINQIIKKISKGSLQKRAHLGNRSSYSIIISDYSRTYKIMNLELFNIDPYWEKLTSTDISELLAKSKNRK